MEQSPLQPRRWPSCFLSSDKAANDPLYNHLTLAWDWTRRNLLNNLTLLEGDFKFGFGFKSVLAFTLCPCVSAQPHSVFSGLCFLYSRGFKPLFTD